jgi:hypothetical protein
MILLLFSLAQAAGVTVGAGGAAGLGAAPLVGAELRVGPVLSETLQAELEGAVFPGGVLQPRLNLQVTGARQTRLRPTVSGGGGVRIGDELTALVHVGPGLSLDLSEHLYLHSDARYLLLLGPERIVERSGAELTLGLSWRWQKAAPEVVAVEPTPPEAEPLAELTVSPPDARIWLPHPECAWLSVSDFERVGLRIEPGLTLRVSADGYLPREITYSPGMSIELERAPAQGTLIVVGTPGDTVTIGERLVSVEEDGVAVISASVGRVALSVLGGGRQVEHQAMISNGHVTWLRVIPPVPLEVTFEMGSSALLPEDITRLQEIVPMLGSYSLTIEGAYSPEGRLEHNIWLANQRTQAVAEILIRAGVPEDRLLLLPPVSPTEDDPHHKQRYVMIVPIGVAP